MLNIYGDFEPTLHEILDDLMTGINDLNTDYQNQYHESLFEHLNGRIKSQDSMKQKCQKNLPLTPYSALRENRDSIGIRIVCNFIDNIYTCINSLEQMSDIQIIKKKTTLLMLKQMAIAPTI